MPAPAPEPKEPVAVTQKIIEIITEITEEKPTPPMNEEKPADQVQNETTSESRALREKATVSGKAKHTTTKPKAPVKTAKPKPKPPVKTTTKKPVTKPTKVKATSTKSKPRAKGTLYGISSLRRVGDVAVNIMSNHTTVRSNFAVGPLILRVEKEVCRIFQRLFIVRRISCVAKAYGNTVGPLNLKRFKNTLWSILKLKKTFVKFP